MYCKWIQIQRISTIHRLNSGTNIHFAHLQVSVAHPRRLNRVSNSHLLRNPRAVGASRICKAFFFREGRSRSTDAYKTRKASCCPVRRRKKPPLGTLYQNTNSYEKLRAFQEFTSLYKYVIKGLSVSNSSRLQVYKPVISFVCWEHTPKRSPPGCRSTLPWMAWPYTDDHENQIPNRCHELRSFQGV